MREIGASGDDVIYIATRIEAVKISLPTEPHQQGPDLHEDSSPWATTRQRNTKDPYDLISSNSKIRALERRETTGRHEFTARRLAYSGDELGRAARGERTPSPLLRASRLAPLGPLALSTILAQLSIYTSRNPLRKYCFRVSSAGDPMRDRASGQTS